MVNRFPLKAACAAAFLTTLGVNALASDMFKVRFPLASTLGGEMVAPIGEAGLRAQVAVTQIELDKVAGPDGNNLQLPVVGNISQTVGSQTYTANFRGLATTGFKQSQTQVNTIIGYLSNDSYGGGRLSVAVNIPYISMSRTTSLTGTTPTLSALSPAASAGLQSAVQNGFGPSYQAGLVRRAALESGSPSGMGDTEVTGAWVYSDQKKRVIASATLVIPTASYDKSSNLNLGFGNYYTLRPSLTMAYNTSDKLTLGARASVGLNTRNDEKDLKSGDFYALDLAAAYRTSVGVFGPHALFVNQYEDDSGSGNNYGANRLSATAVGMFYATRIPGINAGMNISYMQMIEAKNSLSGNFLQVRLTKAF